MSFTLRGAGPDDLERLVDFEIDIARISFGDEAVTDREVHRSKLSKSLSSEPEGMIVAVDATDAAVGWLWVSVRRNFLTGSPYVNFRSLAVAPEAEDGGAGEALMERALEFARERDAGEIVGKVHFGNAKMRILYGKFGYEPQHLTMRRRLPDAEADRR